MKYVKAQLRDLENRIRMFTMSLVEIPKEEDTELRRERMFGQIITLRIVLNLKLNK